MPTVTQHQSAKKPIDPYSEWLKLKNVPLFEGAGVLWRVYQDHCLLPASLKPTPVALQTETAHDLLRRSGASFLRYFTTTFDYPTSFWYTECANYSPGKLSGDTRRRIRQGRERCEVLQIEPAWLAYNGYSCYISAFSRYRNSKPDSLQQFQNECLESADGPFEYWGVFVNGKLAGFTKYIVSGEYVVCSVLKLDPAFLNMRTTYALKDHVLNRYINEQQKRAHDGFRSLLHDTNMLDFLEKFGYRKIYCDLQIRYRRTTAAAINLLYPLRTVFRRTSNKALIRKLQTLLDQEEIRRSFPACSQCAPDLTL